MATVKLGMRPQHARVNTTVDTVAELSIGTVIDSGTIPGGELMYIQNASGTTISEKEIGVIAEDTGKYRRAASGTDAALQMPIAVPQLDLAQNKYYWAITKGEVTVKVDTITAISAGHMLKIQGAGKLAKTTTAGEAVAYALAAASAGECLVYLFGK